MIQQYPHFLFVKSVVESTQDNDGNWSGGSVSWVLHSVCREQTNGKGSVVNGADGKAIVFSAVIHLPLEAKPIQVGTEIKVSESDSEAGIIRITGQVLKFDKGQLHCRIWV